MRGQRGLESRCHEVPDRITIEMAAEQARIVRNVDIARVDGRQVIDQCGSGLGQAADHGPRCQPEALKLAHDTIFGLVADHAIVVAIRVIEDVELEVTVHVDNGFRRRATGHTVELKIPILAGRQGRIDR